MIYPLRLKRQDYFFNSLEQYSIKPCFVKEEGLTKLENNKIIYIFIYNSLMRQKPIVFLSACLLFFVCLIIGFKIALIKPLWGDEIFCQTHDLKFCNSLEIIGGACVNEFEINNSPLFYLVQKGVFGLLHYSFPYSWTTWETALIHDPKAQIILRLGSIVFFSLSITLIYFFFAYYHSTRWGIYALLLTLSSPLVLLYSAEARYYALWFFLTTAQCLLFLKILQNSDKGKLTWSLLISVHVLLSLTVIVSLFQILAFSLILFLFKERKPRCYLFLTLIPVSICLYYNSYRRFFPLAFPQNPWELILVNFPIEQIIFLIGFFILVYLRKYDRKLLKGSKECLYLSFLMLFSTLIMLLHFKIISLLKPVAVPSVYHRHFFHLVPIATISTTFCAISFFQWSKARPFVRTLIDCILMIILTSQCISFFQMFLYYKTASH